jgi:hypothetical protein
MGFGRRPREVYRTFSEEELLEGDTGLDQDPRHPANDYRARNGGSGIDKRGTVVARTRAILLTILATFLGLGVGLAAVTLIDGGALPSVGGVTPGARPLEAAPTAPRALRGHPIGQSAMPLERGHRHRAPGARRAAVAPGGPLLSHAPSARAPEASSEQAVDGGASQANPTSPASEDVAPPATPVASGLSPVAREAGGEFGFER